jgi:uncharacterized membrane protein YkvA (DUF1232 family)
MLKFIKRHWILIISLIYLLWPIDLISDFFGPVGLIDDAGVLLLAFVVEFLRFMGESNSNPKSPKVIRPLAKK